MKGNRFVGLIYNHNPFYLISAGLVLYGVHTSVAVEPGEWVNYWILAAVMAVSVVLMAATAICIVRFGRVWDDARSIFMVLFLLLFALSVSFDELCVANTDLAFGMLSSIFLFAVFVSETVLRVLKIKLSVRFRVPYYLMLALTCFFPLVFSRDAIWHGHVNAKNLLILFPVLASLLIISLVPAIRLSSTVVAKNGTPWKWPFYPWSIFVLMGVGLVGRSFLLCEAFDPSKGSGSVWNTYFLAPFLIGLGVVLVEIGIVENIRIVRQLGLGTAFFALPLSVVVGPGWQSEIYLRTMMSTIGSPVWICAMALLLFYAITWIRQVERSDIWLSVLLATCVWIHPSSYEISPLHTTSWPIALIAGYHLSIGLARRQSYRFLLGVVAMAFGIGMMVSKPLGIPMGVAVAIHVGLFGSLFAGWYFRDRLSLQLNAICAGGLVACSALAALGGWLGEVSFLLGASEICLMIVLAAIFGWGNRDIMLTYSSVISMGLAAIFCVKFLVQNFSTQNHDRLLFFILIAAAFFMIGVVISSLKAGLQPLIDRRTSLFLTELRSRFTRPTDSWTVAEVPVQGESS